MALWTPEEMSVGIWLDGADSSTITLDGSSLVSQWADKSGNARHASQSNSAYRPANSANDGPNFNSTTAYKYLSWTPFSVRSAIWLTRYTNGSGDYRHIASGFHGDTAASGKLLSTTYTTANILNGVGRVNGSIVTPPNIARPTSRSLIFLQPTSTVNFGDTGNGALAADRCFYGVHSEIIASSDVWDTATIQKFEGYLAWKWDAINGNTVLVDALPADHPYKSAAPTTADEVALALNQPISMAEIVALSLNQPVALRKLISLGLDQSVGLELAMMLIQRCRAMPSVRLSLNQWLRDLRRVTLQLDQHVGVCPQVALALDQNLRMPFAPTLSLHQPVAIADQQIALSLVQPVRLEIDGRVTLALGQPCAMTTDAALLQRITLSVTVGGRIVEPDFVSLKTDDSSGFMVATIRFPDVQQYLPCRVGETVVITELLDSLPAEVTVLQVDTLTNPEEHGSADHVLTAISPTVVLDEDRLTDDLGPGVAASLMTTMAAGYGITMDWQGVPGWPLAAGELVAEDETSYAVLVRLAAASGAFLQSLPDGATIRLRPEYAINVEAWPTAATALELNDQDHIFSLDESPDERDGFNAFLVSGQSAAAGDYRLDDTEISATVKEVRCYQVPYRAASTIILGHTGGDWVSIDYLGVHEELIKDEEVVVTAGLGRLQLPYYGGLTWSYKQDGLGTVTAEEDGSLATAQLGDALLAVSYTTKFRKWRLTDPKSESLQIYIDEVI